MTSASWQPDPSGRHETRWWDGQRWTDHVSDHGLTSVDPLVAPATPVVHEPTAQPSTMQQPTMHQPLVQPPVYQPDPYHQVPVEPVYMPTMQQPTLAQPMYAAQPQWDAAPPPNRIPWIIGGVVAAIAIIGGAFVLLNSDDTPSTTASTTIPQSTLPDTTVPQETTTTVAPTTTLPPVDVTGALLVSVLPIDTDVPVEWVRTEEPDPAPPSMSGPGIGYCGGTNSVGRAQLAGSTAQAYGPSWDLPDKTVFAVDAYAFPSETEAADYLTAILKDANACSSNPVQYSMPESEAQWFTTAGFEDTTWAIDEHSGSTKETTAVSDEAVQAFVEQHFAATATDIDYEVTVTTVIYYERWGNIVLAYSLYGRWGYTGWTEPSEFEHQPTLEELLTAAGIVRPVMLQRLTDAGIR